MHPAVVALIIVAVIGLMIVGWRQEQKRLRLLRHWGRARGLTPQADGRKGWDKRYPGLKELQRGHSRQSRLTLAGEIDGRRTVCLDYMFVTGSGKNRTTHRRAVVIVELGFPVIPLVIRREHALDRVGEFLGLDDIDFESAEFSRTFHVSSSDRKWAYDVIHTRTMEYLLQAPSFNVEFGYGEIAVYRTGRFDEAGYQEAVRMAATLHDLVPDYVIKDMKGL